MRKSLFTKIAFALSLISVSALASDLTLYSGRGKAFVDPVVKAFEQDTGLKVNVRYAKTAELLALLNEEKEKSPADIFWAQDGAALSALENLFMTLPDDLYNGQLEIFKNKDKKWVAITSRTRVVVYSPERVKKDALPGSIMDFTDGAWKGKLGWAPTNASFQAFVTIMRAKYGEEATLKWLNTLKANGTKSYSNNRALIQAIADGEIDVAFVNNYYLPRYKDKDPKFPVEQTFLKDGDIGNSLLITGVSITKSSKQKKNAELFTRYLLSPATQQYLSSEGNEYPVVKGTIPNQKLNSLSDITKAGYLVSMDTLNDTEGTRALLRKAGLI